MPDGWLQASVTRLPPALPQHGVVLSPIKLWVLAMLAPKRGCAWLRSRRYAANLTGLARDRPENARSGRRNSRLDQTNEHLSEGIRACRPQCPPNTLARTARAKPINASHTEILTVPDGLTVQPAFWQPGFKNGALTP